MISTTMNMDEYQAAPGYSNGKIKRAIKSLSRYRAEYVNRTVQHEETPAMRAGSMLHMALLEPDKFAETYQEAPPLRDGKGSLARRRKWEEEHPGVIPVTAEDIERAKAFASSVHLGKGSLPPLTGGHSEVSIFWDEDFGTCKCRPDLIVQKTLVALKTTGIDVLDEHAVQRLAADQGWRFEAAWYMRGCDQAGIVIEDLTFLLVEQEQPFLAVDLSISHFETDWAWQLMAKTARRVAECERTGIWPDEHRTYNIETPPYVVSADERRMQDGE